ncbi:hypothetical protein FRC0533_00987 [Corynebacterium diphtheriae]|nr:hypothetical protein FRC0533_00987 [Corynebacterium diphtheriae]
MGHLGQVGRMPYSFYGLALIVVHRFRAVWVVVEMLVRTPFACREWLRVAVVLGEGVRCFVCEALIQKEFH